MSRATPLLLSLTLLVACSPAPATSPEDAGSPSDNESVEAGGEEGKMGPPASKSSAAYDQSGARIAAADEGAQPSVKGSATAGTIEVRGSLDAAIVERIVKARAGEVKACYERALAESPGLSGELTLTFTLDSSGTVTKPSVGSSEIEAASLDDCVTEAVRAWNFPKPSGGGTVMVTVPFVLVSG